MVAVLVLLTIFGIAGFFWYLSYGFDVPPPKSLSLQNIDQPAQITWYENGLAAIESNATDGTVAALGYVHAREKAWQMMLWRQTALGHLTAWYGPSLLRLDRLNRQLRFSDIARETYEALPAGRQRTLDAYAEGVNQAIDMQHLLAHDEFAFIDTEVLPWRPWHTLAVERLFAWMATAFSDLDPGIPADSLPALSSLVASDEILHQFLQLYDFEYSYAGTWQDPARSENAYLYQRLIYGASAHSIIQEVSISKSGEPPFFVASIPGTLLLPAGHSDAADWAILPVSQLSYGRYSPAAPPTTSYERITNRDGTEFLATFNHFPGILSLENAYTPGADSMRALFWKGFEPGTDAFDFLGMLEGEKPDFHLFRGDGLWAQNRRVEILGEPAYQFTLAAGQLISSVPWPKYVAAYLDSLSASTPERMNPKMWTRECYNPWAAIHAPRLLRRIINTGSINGEIYREAITYLRNWGFSYEASSIGAAIFEKWLEELGYPSASSRLTFPPDSLAAAPQPPVMDDSLLVGTFRRAVDHLNHTFGADLSQWRLEQTRPVYRHYPAWASDSLFSPNDRPLSSSNYAPLRFPGKGDVTTLCGGSFVADEFGIVSAQWESWSTKNNTMRAWYWRKQITPESFLERYLISNRPSLEYRFGADDQAPVHQTRIVPANE